VELHALEQGLRKTKENNFTKLIDEGDSKIIINMVNHIQQGPPIEIISNIWHLEASLERIHHIISSIIALILSHIPRSANRHVDWSENEIIQSVGYY